jgi:hypothetical protein
VVCRHSPIAVADGGGPSRQVVIEPVPWPTTAIPTHIFPGSSIVGGAQALKFIRSYLTRDLGIEDAGNYQAASAVSGVLANVVIAATSTDFYPRLVSVIGDRGQAVRIIKQTEIAFLLALPGLSVIGALAPLVTVVHAGNTGRAFCG